MTTTEAPSAPADTEKVAAQEGSTTRTSQPEWANRQVSLSLSTILVALALVVLLALATTFGVLLWQVRADIAGRDEVAADDAHAEQIATDYALGAAAVNYQDFSAWVGKLKANTTTQLSAKFDATAPKLQQILDPLKWKSTATPITAEVATVAGSIYTVDVFLDVTSTSAQTPDGAKTTVTYTVTIDKNLDWKITDVGGTNATLPAK